ncbi:hypothetical protein DFH29DRAFT_871913 [Suillus ampliporus]|nr:hypothetical protein DFH29DRAFT_871913 [Suillus ampliporus]
MKDKEMTSLKANSQTTCPYPSTPRPSSQTPHTGPRFFPQNALPDDDNMEQPLNFLPDPPSSPTSPPTTPTPTHCEISGPTQPTDLLVFCEFKVTTTTPQETTATEAKNSNLHNSIHAPGNTMVDQTMGAPPSPPTTHTQTEEEDAILAHLALAEANRSVLSQNGINHRTILPQFTPTPIGGFPKVHMAHSAQIFDHLDNQVLLTWFQVEHPKFMQREQQSQRNAYEPAYPPLWNSFTKKPLQSASPRPIPKADGDLKISPSASYTAIQLLNSPELLFCLSGFTTSDVAIVCKAVVDVWAHDDNRHHIEDTFSMCSFPDDELVYKATRDLIHSVRVEILDFKVTGGLSVPRFNIFATSPTNNTKTWTELRSFLHILEYPTGLDGCGIAAALYPCQICHSLAHLRGLCPFPLILQWNGPKLSNRNTANLSRQMGRPRGGRPG